MTVIFSSLAYGVLGLVGDIARRRSLGGGPRLFIPACLLLSRAASATPRNNPHNCPRLLASVLQDTSKILAGATRQVPPSATMASLDEAAP